MDGLDKLFGKVYDGFFLRDVLSFILPGCTVVLCAIHGLFLGDRAAENLHSIPGFFQVLGFLGIGYVVGFSIQALGSWLGFVRFYLDDTTGWRRWWMGAWSTRDSDVRFWKATFLTRTARRIKDPDEKDRAELIAQILPSLERRTVLKQMTGNAAITLILGTLLEVMRIATLAWCQIIVLVSLIVLWTAVLMREHKRQVELQRTMEVALNELMSLGLDDLPNTSE